MPFRAGRKHWAVIQLTFRFPDSGEPTFVALRLDASEIGIGQTGERGELHGLPIDLSGGTRFELCVYCEDTDAAIAHLREHGVQVLYEPNDQPWAVCPRSDGQPGPHHGTDWIGSSPCGPGLLTHEPIGQREDRHRA